MPQKLQGFLPFKYEEEKDETGMTALAGLPMYLELACVAGLRDSIERHVKVCNDSQGWTDAQVLLSLVLLNIAGGSCVDDLEMLQGDAGFGEVLRRVETHGMPRAKRRGLLKRWRKERLRSVPSPSAARRRLEAFHDAQEMASRQDHTAFIPAASEHLQAMTRVNADLLNFVAKRSKQKVATLDQDATLIETYKDEALFCYKGFKAYQPLNTYWAEEELMVHTEFRDGNVPAGHEALRVLQDALLCLPDSVEKVMLRADTACYQHDVMRFCARERGDRFGVIEFAISADVTPQFKAAVSSVPDGEWRGLEPNTPSGQTRQEWAEVVYVPNVVAHDKKCPEFRYIAIREPLRSVQTDLNGQLILPNCPAVDFGVQGLYKVSGIVTNRTYDMPGNQVIRWQRQRCGKSEEAHSVLKEDLAGGQLPSGKFGANAAWWGISVLAFNLNSIMKRMVLKGEWANKRLKAIRFAFINLPGRIVHHARQLIIRLTKGHPSNSLLLEARRTSFHLAYGPSG